MARTQWLTVLRNKPFWRRWMQLCRIGIKRFRRYASPPGPCRLKQNWGWRIEDGERRRAERAVAKGKTRHELGC